MLDVSNLSVVFDQKGQRLTAVDDVSFSVRPGSTLGIVGESGSGKTVSALSILGLLPPTATLANGSITWNNSPLTPYSELVFKRIRGREIGLIFQNPLAALNPVYTIGNQFIETLRLHFGLSKSEAKAETIAWLRKVNIPDPEKRINDYPHQFSIGMCQRIMIALTVAMKPKLLIADEPTASLDVTIQSQILQLLNDLKDELGMSILMISHDLGVIAQHCDDIAVMYLGKVVERGSTSAIFKSPRHPYTQALIQSIPVADPDAKQSQSILTGDVPSLYDLPKGCRFNTRCPHVMDQCYTEMPGMNSIDSSDVACFLYD